MDKSPFEIYETPDGSARFYFSHSDEKFTTGILVLQPGAALPKHNRPHAIENDVQIGGKCLMTIFGENENNQEVELSAAEGVGIPKGQWHIHGNPYNEVSVTLFKLEGDILEVMRILREMNKKVESNLEKNTHFPTTP